MNSSVSSPRWSPVFAAGALLALLAWHGPVHAETVSFQDIEESLTCQCGCGLTVHSCNHLNCGSAIPLRQEIRQQMALGKDRAEILSHFEKKYGEKILSAPTTTGFNLLAWTTPFVLLILAGTVLTFVVVRWRGQSESGAQESPSLPKQDSAYRDILEKELKNFDS